jgi:hypothetical protein
VVWLGRLGSIACKIYSKINHIVTRGGKVVSMVIAKKSHNNCGHEKPGKNPGRL